MSFIDLFKNKRNYSEDEWIRPYSQRVNDALRQGNLPTAIAYMTKANELAPERLDVLLMRAQIYQYGLGDFTAALKDYRAILLQLENEPDRELASKCKAGMKDMMGESES